MGQYDGAVLINTKIDTKSANVKLEELRIRMTKTADKIASLSSKMDSLKDARIPTKEYTSLQKDLDKATEKFEELNDAVKTFEKIGADKDFEPFKQARADAQDMLIQIEDIRGKMFELEETGKAFTLGSETEKFVKLSQQLQYAENEFSLLNQKHEILELKQKRNIDSYKRLGDIAKKALTSVGNMLKKINSLVDSFGKRIRSAFSNLGKSAAAANQGFSGISLSLKNILKYGFGIRSLYMLVNKLRSGLKEGFENLLTYSKSLENSINGIKATSLTLKNAFAAAFSPFVEIALPYVQKLLDYMVQLVNITGQFIAALTGQKKYTKAIRQTADAFKKAENAAKGYLGPLDEINKYQSEYSSKEDGSPGIMFEEVAIEGNILNVADKVKDILSNVKDVLSKLFNPLKEAWNREGKSVMDSWKYALEEVGKLIRDIGRDFLTVWQEDATIKIFRDILQIIGDIGTAIGNLARNFREAWNTNEVGLSILRNIRDIIGIIVQHIRNAADATAEWADKLDFYPLLDAVNGFLVSLKPVVDAVMGILEDFYTKVLLPLSKWTIEKGLPELLQVLIDFNNMVDWESLRANLAEFWEHLEPFAETVGEGLIIFIRRVSEALANFLNSQQFKDFLVMIENWMDSVSPEDVADALEKIAKGLITLKLALLGYNAIKGITAILTTIKTFLSFFGVGGAGTTTAKGLDETTTALGGLAGAISDVAIATTAAVAVVEPLKDKMIDLAEAEGAQAQTVADAKEKYDGWFGSLRLVGDEIKGLLLGMQGLPVTIASSVGAVDALNKAMEAVADGAIYTDAQMQKMQDTWGFTADDMEMLRQEMLDTNHELRSLADRFPELSDASAESLSQINRGFEYMKNGVTDTDDIIFRLNHSFGELTPTTQTFFDNMTNGRGALADYNYELQTGGQAIDDYAASLENTSGAIEQFSNDVVEAGTNIGEGLNAGMENVDTGSPAAGFFDKFVASIKSVFGIHSPASTMNPFGENILLGVIEGFKSKFAEFTALISQLFTQISYNFKSGLDSVKGKWSGAWDNMRDKVRSIIDGIKDIIQSALSWITDKISSITDKISSIKDKVSSISSIGSKVSGMFSDYSFDSGIKIPVSPVVAALSNVEIPAYATGQVIPRTMKQHLAILGDNTRETEVVSPLSTIKQALTEVATEMGGISGNGNLTLNVYLHDDMLYNDKKIFEATVRQGKIEQMSSGKNRLLLEN